MILREHCVEGWRMGFRGLMIRENSVLVEISVYIAPKLIA